MQSLLQTRPENLDDLTVQVALVRPGPIQGKAVHPYIEHRQEDARRSDVRAAGRARVAARGAARHARRRRLPGSGARRRDGRGEVLDRRGGRTAPRDEQEAQRGGDRGVPPALRRRLPRQRHRRADGARDLRQARRLLRLRVPEVACRGVRAARVPVGVAPPLLPGRVPVRAPERAADGLLPAVVARARRAAARGRGSPAAHQPTRRRSARSRTAPCVSASATCSRSERRMRRRSKQGSRMPTSAISPGARR